MSEINCKLYDDNLVRNIMITTGLSVIEYVKNHSVADAVEICDHIDANSENIIKQTIENMNNLPDSTDVDTYAIDEDWDEDEY